MPKSEFMNPKTSKTRTKGCQHYKTIGSKSAQFGVLFLNHTSLYYETWSTYQWQNLSEMF